MRLNNISIRYSAMLIMVIVIIPILLILAGINYVSLKNNIIESVSTITEQSKQSAIETIISTEKNYELLSSHYDSLMQESLEAFKKQYKKNRNNIFSINLEEMKKEYNDLLDFYIINKEGIIIFSTLEKSIGIDFKKYSDFYAMLTRIRKGNKIKFSKVTSELETCELRKWAYLSTDDHEYVLQVGLAAEELKTHINKLDYVHLENKVKQHNPYISSMVVYNNLYMVLGQKREEKDDEELKNINKVLRTKKDYIIRDQDNFPDREYILVDAFSDMGQDTKKVILIRYDYNKMKEKLDKVNERTAIVISIYILIALLVISYIVSKMIIRPIISLTEGVDNLLEKNLDINVEIYGENEIGQLATSFNKLSTKLDSTLISKNNLENIIDSIGGLFILLDKDFKIMKVNQYGLRLMEYNLKDIKGKSVQFIFDEKFDEKKIAEEVAIKGISRNIEHTLIKSSEESIVILALFSPLKDESGKITGYTCMGKDITKAKQQLERMERINEKLKERNTTDWLTKVLSKEHITKSLEKVLKTARKEKTDFSIILCDIDHFKKINDTYGHVVGDKVLQQVADMIKQNLRKEDFVGRYGGEEFLIVLQNADVDKAWEMAEKIRKKIQASVFNEGEVKITLSSGIACWQGDETKELIEKADEKLYVAKRAGRNRSVR